VSFALCAPQGSTVPSRLIGYAAQRLSALARTSVYIDAGAADWPKGDPAAAARILLPAGIEHARGFALNSTHYVSVGSDIAFGAQIVAELADHGVRGKHFVINTAQNGRPFLIGQAMGPTPTTPRRARPGRRGGASRWASRRPQRSPRPGGRSRRSAASGPRPMSTPTSGSGGPGCATRRTRSCSAARWRSPARRRTEPP
jgi:hypothetical protein